MRTLRASAVLVTLLLAVPATGQDHLTSPYRGEPRSPIGGLTADEVSALRDGSGMGLARAAELNSYPGPRHVLDAVRDARLPASADQVLQTTAIFDGMRQEAQLVGAQILAEEASLEAAFKAATITETDLRSRVARIAGLQGKLRTIHLAAHLATRAVLTEEQIQQYNVLRGYAAGSTGHEHHGH
ncbi:MAG TPA: hypothetical protein VJX92_27245 [Methylomirabilota bacterium]|nr:hypothetical protein [Methylomirabilota bacterium]